MKVTVHKVPFDYIVVEDMYDRCELDLIWQELLFLTPSFLPPDKTGAARNSTREIKKQGSGIFLDSFYSDRNLSNILRLNRKLWSPKILQPAIASSPWWSLLRSCNKDATLLNHYLENEYYGPHEDMSMISAVTILYKEDSKFSGGNFVFTDYDITVPKQSNLTVIFPGPIMHQVTPVQILPNGNFSGRYSIAQFLLLTEDRTQ